jgi:outer membrane biosynthesis protein TonB
MARYTVFNVTLTILLATALISAALVGFKNGKEEDVIYVNCDSFNTQPEAQEYFLEHNATHLDADKDGEACEDNASPTNTPIFLTPIPTKTPVQATPTPNDTPLPFSSDSPTPTPTPESSKEKPTPSDEPEESNEPTPTPSNNPTTTPAPGPTPTPMPTASPLACILGICI